MRKLEDVFSGVIALAAVSMAAMFTYRVFHQPLDPIRLGGSPEYRLIRVPIPEEVENAGVLIGGEHPDVEITEFSDLQCPFCKTSHDVIRRLMQQHPEKVSYRFVHYPVSTHPVALVAARAAECARAQGSFVEMVDALFGQQDSLGLKPWAQFADEAGVTNVEAFSRCLSDQRESPAIRQGIGLGRKLKVRGTPTVLVNGWRFEMAPRPSDLEGFLESILAGRSPLNTGKDTLIVLIDSHDLK